MSIKIDQIHARNLGPIAEADYSLKAVNLFYGKNESGKTYLTEFLLRSIFKDAKDWSLRNFDASGYVSVTGLGPEPIHFSPESTPKIEDHWAESLPGLPLNMGRLLAVKSADLSFSSKDPGGVGRDVLRDALTSQHLINSIRDSIPATVQKAELIGSEIIGRKQGKLKDLEEITTSLAEINTLLEEIENEYSRGTLQQIKLQTAAINRELDEQQAAKEHHALLLWNEQQRLAAEREKYSDEVLLAIRDQIRETQRFQADLDAIKKKLTELAPHLELYSWLKKAIQVWEKNKLEQTKLPSIATLIIGGCVLLFGLGTLLIQELLSLQGYFWAGLTGVILGAGIAIYYGFRYYQWTTQPTEAEERTTIQAAFKKKFGHRMGGLTDLLHQLEGLEKDFHQKELLDEELVRINAKLESGQDKVEIGLQELVKDVPPSSDWDQIIDDLFNRARDLDQDLGQAALAFAKLNIEEGRFRTDPPPSDYDAQRVTELSDLIAELDKNHAKQESDLNDLKVRACARTGDSPSENWDLILSNLRLEEKRMREERIKLIAELTAMIGLTSILDQLAAEEDQKIISTINSKAFSSLLQRLTGKYSKMRLYGDELIL